MRALDAVFRRLQRHAPEIMACSLFVGLLVQDLSAIIAPAVLSLATGAMMLALVRLDWPRVRGYLRRPILAIVVGLAAMVGAPLVIIPIIHALPLDPSMQLGLSLMAASPPITSAAAFCLFLGLDAALAMVVAVAFTVITPLLMPALLLTLFQIEMSVSFVDFTLRLAAMVGAAFGGSMLVRWLTSENTRMEKAHWIDGITVLCIAAFGIGIMNGLAPLILADPPKMVAYAIAVFALWIGLTSTGLLLRRWLAVERSLTIGLLMGMRNLMLVTGAVAGTASSDLMLILVLGQFPLYTGPMLLRPVIRRLMARASST